MRPIRIGLQFVAVAISMAICIYTNWPLWLLVVPWFIAWVITIIWKGDFTFSEGITGICYGFCTLLGIAGAYLHDRSPAYLVGLVAITAALDLVCVERTNTVSNDSPTQPY